MDFKPISRIESSIPDVLNENLDSYDPEIVKAYPGSHFYLVGGEYVYLEGLLTIKQSDFNEKLEWLLWTKVPARPFLEMTQNMSGEKSSVRGQIISPVLFYEDTEGLEVNLVFALKDKVKFPRIEVFDNHSELFSDFVSGMTKEKYLKWQGRFQEIN